MMSRLKLPLLILLLAALAVPASALKLYDSKERAKVMATAVSDAEKAAEANDINKARLILLGISQYDVPEEVKARHAAVVARCWPDEKITPETRDKAFEALDPVILKYAVPTNPNEREKGGDFILYPDVVSKENDLQGNVALSDLATWILDATKQYDTAMKRALEFVALAPSPRWFDDYNYNGNKGNEFRIVRTALLNLYLGPAIVETHKKDELLSWSLENVQKELDRYATIPIRSPSPTRPARSSGRSISPSSPIRRMRRRRSWARRSRRWP